MYLRNSLLQSLEPWWTVLLSLADAKCPRPKGSARRRFFMGTIVSLQLSVGTSCMNLESTP